MQGMNGSSVVGLGGQHTEPVKTVYEFADGLAVTVQVFGSLHIGGCDLSHLQSNLYSFDFINGLCPHGFGHQPVQTLVSVHG